MSIMYTKSQVIPLFDLYPANDSGFRTTGNPNYFGALGVAGRPCFAMGVAVPPAKISGV